MGLILYLILLAATTQIYLLITTIRANINKLIWLKVLLVHVVLNHSISIMIFLPYWFVFPDLAITVIWQLLLERSQISTIRVDRLVDLRR